MAALDTYALDPGALDHAAARIAEAVGSLTDLDVTSPLGVAGAGLPGTRTEGACRSVATRLDAAIQGWAEHVADLCETARRVARDAAENDLEVADRYAVGGRG